MRRLLHKFIKIALAIGAFYRAILSKTLGGLLKYLAEYDRIIKTHLRVINTKLGVGIKRFNHCTFIVSRMELMCHMIDEMRKTRFTRRHRTADYFTVEHE